jgi:hypothetical protein
MTARTHVVPRGVEEAEALAAKPVELASFSGGDSFGMIARFAAHLEQDGRRPALRWTRDERGIISGLAVVEDAQ